MRTTIHASAMTNSAEITPNVDNWRKLIDCAANMPRRYSDCITTSIQLLAANRRHQLRSVAFHQVRIPAVMIFEELHAVRGRLNR